MNISQGIDLKEIEAVLREHHGVREAAVALVAETAQGDKRLIACVVPDYDRIDRSPAGTEEERKRVLKIGRLYDLVLKTRNAEPAKPGSNFLGWNSSYTKQPIPWEQMRESVDLTVEEILSLRPSEVLEIGCGSGLLLLGIARGCKRYVGMDVSAVSLQAVGMQMEDLEGPWDAVTLLERPADDFSGLDGDSFDTAIINSVIQYFPNVAYLTRVLDGAIGVVRPGGVVFIGDVRSLPLMETFSVSVELYQAQPASLLKDLRGRVRRRINVEGELAISPAFFMAFQRRSSKVSRVEIRPKRGQFENEMNGFRYDAILHLGSDREPGAEVAWLDSAEKNLTLDAIRGLLNEEPVILGIMRVANARIEKDVEALNRLSTADSSRTVEDFKEELRHAKTRGIDPPVLWALGEELGYQVDISWASSRTDGSYDVLFRQLAAGAQPHRAAVAFPQPETVPDDLGRYGNRPGQIALRQSLVSQLNEHCKRRLSEYMVPAAIVIVDALPLTADGVLNHQAPISTI